ncbi:hypothetical protein OK016_26710 [Vibrio chagasii]|nr:hypothetical protein [Vibrio chagasii]
MLIVRLKRRQLSLQQNTECRLNAVVASQNADTCFGFAGKKWPVTLESRKNYAQGWQLSRKTGGAPKFSATGRD